MIKVEERKSLLKNEICGLCKKPANRGVVTFLDAYPQLVSPVMSRFSPLRIKLQAVSFGMTQVVSFERYYHIGVLTWLQQSYKPQKRIKRGILQNEPK